MGTIDNEYETRCNQLAAPDPAEYPAEWTPEQCGTAYWYALSHLGHDLATWPHRTEGWHSILAQAHRVARRHHQPELGQ